jgi:hypothetical protein
VEALGGKTNFESEAKLFANPAATVPAEDYDF